MTDNRAPDATDAAARELMARLAAGASAKAAGHSACAPMERVKVLPTECEDCGERLMECRRAGRSWLSGFGEGYRVHVCAPADPIEELRRELLDEIGSTRRPPPVTSTRPPPGRPGSPRPHPQPESGPIGPAVDI